MKRILSLLFVITMTVAAWAQTVVVTRPGVNLRMGPSLNAGKLIDSRTRAAIHPPQWARLPYYGQSGDFYKTEYMGYTVYISKLYSRLEGSGTTSRSTGTTYVYVDGYHVRLRTGPSTSYPYLTDRNGTPIYAPQYGLLPYYGRSGYFYKVGYNGGTYYISSDYTHLTTR